jgi:hypothetical protein
MVRLKATKPDESALAEDAEVSISQVDCKLNNKLITPSVLSYPYKAYLETLLAHSRESKQSWLASEITTMTITPLRGRSDEWKPRIEGQEQADQAVSGR